MISLPLFLLLAAALPEDVVAETPPTPAETATAEAPPARAATRESLRILQHDLRMEAYDEFRALYETRRFDEALPYAKRVVELSEADSDRDRELPIAYNNLGATQYHLGDYAAAAESYTQSLDLLESTQGISSRRLIVPLSGLGAAYAALDQHDVAAALLERALAVSRRADGLFNLAQLPLIEQVAISRMAVSDYTGAEREHLYALKVAEQNYGYADERTMPAVLQLATFYESLREYTAARLMYLRGREIAVQESGGLNPLAIKCLVGIARTHRLQYSMDPDSLQGQIGAKEQTTAEFFEKVYRESRVPPPGPDRTGIRAAQSALELLRATPDPPKPLLAETLIELGDWFQSAARPADALPYYAEASVLLESEPLLGNPLSVPRMVVHRPPSSAIRNLNATKMAYVLRKAEFRFRVSESGVPLDIEVVSTDMSDWQLSQSKRALSRAIYSPRLVDGKVVMTENVAFTSQWYEEQETPTPPTPEPEPASAGGR